MSTDRIVYAFGQFTMEHDLTTGMTTTMYLDGCYSACPVVPDDAIHALELGVTPKRHRLLHELWHHLVGIHVLGEPSSPTIWRDAHGYEQSEESDHEEWLVTALTHAMHGRTARDHGARAWLKSEGHDVGALLDEGRWLVEGADMPGVRRIYMGTVEPAGSVEAPG